MLTKDKINERINKLFVDMTYAKTNMTTDNHLIYRKEMDEQILRLNEVEILYSVLDVPIPTKFYREC